MLPLPVKKNKNGQRVADISVTDYYGQIMEEVLEAFRESELNAYGAYQNDEYGDPNYGEKREAEELVDVITTCVTRIEIIDSAEGLEKYVAKLDKKQKNFYRDLEELVLVAHEKALEKSAEFEEDVLIKIIGVCIARLRILGYKRKAREEIYAAVNEKNRKRGYFEK